jgi:hypothetical protein
VVVTGVIAGSLMLSLGGCGSSSKSASTDAATTDAAASAQAATTATTKYVVSVDSAAMGEDYQGNPCVIVSYTFTNNDEDAQSFMVAVNPEVYQNGTQCETAVCSDIDSQAQLSKIKTGTTEQVQVAYTVSDTSDVEVEVYEFASISKTPLAKQTFSLA